jgi:hypothetical protein
VSITELTEDTKTVECKRNTLYSPRSQCDGKAAEQEATAADGELEEGKRKRKQEEGSGRWAHRASPEAA